MRPSHWIPAGLRSTSYLILTIKHSLCGTILINEMHTRVLSILKSWGELNEMDASHLEGIGEKLNEVTHTESLELS